MNKEDLKDKIYHFLKGKTLYKKKNPGHVYVLLLYKNKIYVGFSKDTEYRIKQHFRNTNVEWLKCYPPKELVIIIKNVNIQFESILTKFLMIEFGINNVRGGPYTKVTNYDFQPKDLTNFKLTNFKNY